MPGNDAKGVLLLNLGGPDTLDAVRPFLFNLFSDRDIIRLGPALLQRPIAWLIATTRAPKTRSFYRQIGGGSPIVRITREQGEALRDVLHNYGRFPVYIGMRYWHPFIGDALDEMAANGITEFLALSLYPQYSVATTGSAYREVERELNRHSMRCHFAGPWYDNPFYIGALTESIIEAAGETPRELTVLYSAHSLPQSFIDGGDPYAEHTTATIALVNEKLTKHGYKVDSYLSYQSKSGPVRWLGPSTEETIRRLAGKGERQILMVPISFVSDHIETLYEIDILYRDLALMSGVELKRTRSLNTSPLFIEALKDVVLRSPLGGGVSA